jgi:hypothetical protein
MAIVYSFAGNTFSTEELAFLQDICLDGEGGRAALGWILVQQQSASATCLTIVLCFSCVDCNFITYIAHADDPYAGAIMTPLPEPAVHTPLTAKPGVKVEALPSEAAAELEFLQLLGETFAGTPAPVCIATPATTSKVGVYMYMVCVCLAGGSSQPRLLIQHLVCLPSTLL